MSKVKWNHNVVSVVSISFCKDIPWFCRTMALDPPQSFRNLRTHSAHHNSPPSWFLPSHPIPQGTAAHHHWSPNCLCTSGILCQVFTEKKSTAAKAKTPTHHQTNWGCERKNLQVLLISFARPDAIRKKHKKLRRAQRFCSNLVWHLDPQVIGGLWPFMTYCCFSKLQSYGDLFCI